MPAEYVLDTFAVIALIRAERGKDRVLDLLAQAERGGITCRFSVINAGEVAYIVERESGLAGAEQFLATLRRTPVIVEDATWQRILAAAHIKARYALSYADAFAVALAQERGATVVTGDPEFELVAHNTRIEWLNG